MRTEFLNKKYIREKEAGAKFDYKSTPFKVSKNLHDRLLNVKKKTVVVLSSLPKWRSLCPLYSRPWRATSRSPGRSPAPAPARNIDRLCPGHSSTGSPARHPPRSGHGSPHRTPRPSSTSSTTPATSAATALPSGGLCLRRVTSWRWCRRRPSMSPTFQESIWPPRSRRTRMLVVEGTNRWGLCLFLGLFVLLWMLFGLWFSCFCWLMIG